MKGAVGGKSVFADEKGMALLLTVMIVSLLVGITMIFHQESWQSYRQADSYKTNGYLRTVAESGINIGMELLYRRKGEDLSASFFDSWATLEEETFNPLFDNGRLRLVIEDLSGRLQLNSLVQTTEASGGRGKSGKRGGVSTAEDLRKILYRLLLSGEFVLREEDGARDIVDAIVDWIDKDDDESDYGAESNYYQALDPPYECRNGPLETVEELLLVKGVTPLLLFGNGKKRGLADVVTVYGNDGRMNINTMDPLLLRSMDSLVDAELAIAFDQFRKDKTNRESLADPGWYKKVTAWPGDVVLNEKLLTTKSSYFLLHSTGKGVSRSYHVTAVVRRNGDGTMEMVHRKVE
ncbi:general secretion pathway protein GspK [Desulfomarina sp.]